MSQIERARHLVAMADAQLAGEQIQIKHEHPNSVWVTGIWGFDSLTAMYRIKPKVAVGAVLELTRNIGGISSDGFNTGDTVQVIHIGPSGLLCVHNTPEKITEFTGATNNSGLGVWWVYKNEYKISSEPAAKPLVKKWINFYNTGYGADEFGVGRAEYVIHASEESAKMGRSSLSHSASKDYLGTTVYEVS